jgi:hypothetical protein
VRQDMINQEIINPECSINRLVVGMFEDAVRQARAGDPYALEWLYGDGLLWVDIVMDIHPDHIRRYLDGIPKPPQKQKPARRKPAKYAESEYQQQPQDKRKRTRPARTMAPAASPL